MIKQQHNRDRDYVDSLLSGRIEQRKSSDGDTVLVFIPKQVNKYQPLGSIYAKTKKSQTEILIAENIQLPLMEINHQVFKKTLEEKQLFKKIKAEWKSNLIEKGFDPKKRRNVSEPQFVHWRAFD